MASVAPMKLITEASNRRTSSQNPDVLYRGAIAAVPPTLSAATTVNVAASMWNSGKGV